MASILRRHGLGLKSCQGIIAACDEPISLVRNDGELTPDDVWIRWGCTSSLPVSGSKDIINHANAIHFVADKTSFRRELEKKRLCPKTWFSVEEFLESGDTYPVIVRSKHHAQGRGMWAVSNEVGLQRACEMAGADYYINKYIPKTEEYRVFCIQDRVAWVARKTPADPTDIAWNVAKGGRFDNVRWGSWNMNVIRAALEAHKLTGLHFSGVDVMVDAYGDTYVLEANSAPSQTSPYRQSCVGKVFNWMLKNNELRIHPFEDVEMVSWRHAIHVGVRS